jgi:hypothetical protein
MFVNRINHAVVTCATSGANTLVAAPTDGSHIVIDQIHLIPAGAVTATLKSGATGITGAMTLSANQQLSFENILADEGGVLTCAADTALTLTLGGAVQVSGFVNYRLVN